MSFRFCPSLSIRSPESSSRCHTQTAHSCLTGARKDRSPRPDAYTLNSIQTKSEFWDHVHLQLSALLDGQRYWVCRASPSTNLDTHIRRYQTSRTPHLSSTVRYWASRSTLVNRTKRSTGQVRSVYSFGSCGVFTPPQDSIFGGTFSPYPDYPASHPCPPTSCCSGRSVESLPANLSPWPQGRSEASVQQRT